MNLPHLLALAACILLTGCGQKPAPATSTSKPTLTVTTAEVQRHNLARVIEAQGQIAPWQEAVLSAKVAGVALTELYAEVGARVQRGQLLARFDTRALNVELAQARANLVQAAANAKQALDNRDRVLRMQGKGAISEQNLQQEQTQVEMANAQREIAQAQLEALEIRLTDCEIRAVDDGVISARLATLGQVPPVGAELFHLIRQERLEWQAQLNPQQLAQAAPGQHVSVTLPDGKRVNGTLRLVAPTLDHQSRLGLAYVALENGSGARAGTFASGLIELTEQAALVVPAEAVVLRDGRSSVFRVDDEGKVSQVPIVTGRREGAVVEIRDGLAENAKIAVRGAGFLVDGDRIRIAEAPPSGGVGEARVSQSESDTP